MRSPLFAPYELFQLIERPCPGIRLPVDEKCRSAVHAKLFPFRDVGGDGLLEPLAIYIFAEAVEVQAQLPGVIQQIVPLCFRLIGEKQVVHLPELALLFRGQRGLMGELRVGVDAERKVLELDCGLNAVNTFCLQLSKRLRKLRAKRALKIREEDNLDRRRRRSGRLLGAGCDLGHNDDNEQR